MDNEQYALYENARRRLKQKKMVYFHFVLMLVGSLFFFVANVLLEYGKPLLWYRWVAVIWFFFFILHFIKVFITDRFMNKAWEQEQISRLVAQQKNRIKELSEKNLQNPGI